MSPNVRHRANQRPAGKSCGKAMSPGTDKVRHPPPGRRDEERRHTSNLRHRRPVLRLATRYSFHPDARRRPGDPFLIQKFLSAARWKSAISLRKKRRERQRPAKAVGDSYNHWLPTYFRILQWTAETGKAWEIGQKRKSSKAKCTLLDFSEQLCGDPNGTRTRVTGVRGRCPRPLDDRATNATLYT